MVPVVVLVLALLAPSLSLPFAIPEYTQVEREASVTHNVPQTQSGVQEKTGVPVTGCLSGFSAPVTQENVRVQDAPVNVEQAPSPHTETFFLPPQPVPVTQVDQTVRPVIVPGEAIASGRVIVMAVEPVQQRAFPDVVIVPQQSIITDIPIQAVEKQTPYQESISPVQSSSNTEPQVVHKNFNQVSQTPSQVQPETTQHQVFSKPAVEKQVAQPVSQVQPVQQQAVQQPEYVEKQSSGDYVPVIQSGEPVQKVQTAEFTQEHNVQPTVEKQLQENAQVEPVPHPEVFTAPGNVQKQVECAAGQTQFEPQQRVDVQQSGEQVQQPEGEVYQQQTYSVQPEQIVQQVQLVQAPQQVPEVHHPAIKTEAQEVDKVPQQISTYTSGQIYNFGDKIPQQHTVKTPNNQQQYLLQPVVVGNLQ